MDIIFSETQRQHRHRAVLYQGQMTDSYEAPERLDAILSALDAAALGPIVPPDEMDLAPIHAVHDEGMVAFLATAYARHAAGDASFEPVFPSFFPPPGQRRRPDTFEAQKGFYCVDMEVPIGPHTWEAARASAACAWTGAQRLLEGERYVYALCRPPGHHAGSDFMGGYCYLNNAAVAARALSKEGARIAIVDIDTHHGNGTQAIFYTDPDVWYGSLHADPRTTYPFFAGYADEVGAGRGEGTNRNLPLPRGTDDAEYLRALGSLLALVEAFDPRWVVVSAGFDAYVHDPVSTFAVTTEGFREAGRRIRGLQRPTLVVQEGGYHLPDLGANVLAFLEALEGS